MNQPARFLAPAASSRPDALRSRLDKRGNGRIPARSRMELRHGPKLGARKSAELLNVGRGGFRARYGGRQIKTGKLVAFRHEFAGGYARVRWTKPAADLFESGFEIVVN